MAFANVLTHSIINIGHGQDFKLSGDKNILSIGLPTKCKWLVFDLNCSKSILAS